MVDARLPDGSRLHAVIPPLAVDGPCVTIRRFGARAVPLEAFEAGPAASAFLRWAVLAGWNLLVAGGHERGQDHAAQRALDGDSRTRARRDDRGDRRAPARAATRRAARSTTTRTPRAPAGSRCASSCAPRSGCGPIASSSERSAVARRSTCSRRSTPGTTDRCPPCTPTARPTRSPRLETLVLLADAGLPLSRCARRSPRASTSWCSSRVGPAAPRAIEAIAEVDEAADAAARVRPLFRRARSGLIATGGRPSRAPRRPEARAWPTRGGSM